MATPAAKIADEEAPDATPEVSSDPKDWNLGKYPPQIVAGIFKEWRKAGPKADIPLVKIKYVMDFEFSPKDEPTRKLLEDSVLRLPYLKPVKKERYDPYTGKRLADVQPYLFDPATGKSYTDRSVEFDQGQFVEFLGDNMQWQLAKIRRIVKIVRPDSEDPDDPDYDYFYNIGSESLIPPKRVRAPEEGLKLLFGFGPWVFQQWACLQIESLTRFQEYHDLDIDQGSFEQSARDLFDFWLTKNPEFSKILDKMEEDYEGCRSKLITHIVSPFKLMDEMVAERDSRWNFEGVSLYTYNSFLGSGWLTALSTLFIQLMVPAILLMTAVNLSSLPTDNNNYAGQNRFYAGLPFDTNWTTFCSGVGTMPTPDQAPYFVGGYFPQGKVMNICVLVIYMIRVVPALMSEFVSSTGGGEDTLSRLNALRDGVWDQGDDTAFQQLGYKLGKYMNSLYVAILMSLMLFILFLTNDIFSIILNALALEFVHTLDEELAAGDWWDPGQRYIRAAALEFVLRVTLRLEFLEDAEKFCIEFDIPPEDYRKAMSEVKVQQVSTMANKAAKLVQGDDYLLPLKDAAQGRADSQNPKLMSKKMRYYHMAADLARKEKNVMAMRNFCESVEQFGTIDRVLAAVGLLDTGIFMRHKDFYVWSRWARLLTISRLPKAVGEKTGADGKTRTIWRYDSLVLCSNRIEAQGDGKKSTGSGSKLSQLAEMTGAEAAAEAKRKLKALAFGAESGDQFLNYYDNSDESMLKRFMDDVMDTIFFLETVKSIRIALKRGKYHTIPFRLIDSLVQWFV